MDEDSCFINDYSVSELDGNNNNFEANFFKIFDDERKYNSNNSVQTEDETILTLFKNSEFHTVSTENETINTIESTQNKKKIEKTQGRKKKSEANQKDNEGQHTKFSKDNIRRKIKVHFTQFVIKFLNAKIKLEWNGHQKNKFRTLDDKLTKNITISANYELHSLTIKYFMSQNVSRKFKCDSEQNKKTVKTISELRPEVFDPLLNMKVKEFFESAIVGIPMK